jgi:hypothetical protein
MPYYRYHPLWCGIPPSILIDIQVLVLACQKTDFEVLELGYLIENLVKACTTDSASKICHLAVTVLGLLPDTHCA